MLTKKYGLNWKSHARMKILVEKVRFFSYFFIHVLNNLNNSTRMLYYKIIYYNFNITAETIFPSLNNMNFKFTDAYDARLDPEFLIEFVQSSARGVILKIKPGNNFLDICKREFLTYLFKIILKY